jgi:hypothetical protein
MLPEENHVSETQELMDQFFWALDGAPADGLPARILGIHDDGRERWIQIARGDDATDAVVLRVSRFASVRHASAALTRWDPPLTNAPRVIRAMCLAERFAAPESGVSDTAV